MDDAAGLGEIFTPRSIAVIGASNHPGSVGASLFRNILTSGYTGVVYPVNPSWKSVSGVRCYPSVGALPEAPDLAIVIVPAPAVTPVVDQLGRRGTKGVVVISAGFREIGGAGVAREAALVRVARRHRMSLVGPNCFGVLNTDPGVSLNATFSDTLPRRGHVAFVSQSGALCAGILRYGEAERIGFSRFLSVGNRAGLSENELLPALAADRATRVILLYIESLANVRQFLEAARKITETKPVLVIKSGRSPLGERAARSHTGSLARSGQDRVYDALFEQSGVLRCDSISELFRNAKIFGSGLKLEEPRLAILTNSGGPGIMAADACSRLGLSLPELSPAVPKAVRAHLSPSATIANPLDMTADAGPEEYRRSLRALLNEPQVRGALVIATPTGTATAAAIAAGILAARGRSPKPVVACLFGLSDVSKEVQDLEERGVPTFTFPEEAVAGLASLAQYTAWGKRPRLPIRRFRVDRPAVRAVLRDARQRRRRILPEYAARRLLAAYGFPFPSVRSVHTLDEGLRAAAELGYPVALKVASPDISHKTEVGGVALDLTGEEAFRVAWGQMALSLQLRAPTAHLEGFEVERMIRGGKEVLLGLQRDPAFGPILAFGMGGIYVEVLNDVTFRLAPIRPLSARRMVAAVRGAPLLEGVRGEPPSDLPALYDAIQRLSQLAVEVPEIVELDINPLLVLPAGHGVVAVDARIALAPSSRSERSPSAAR